MQHAKYFTDIIYFYHNNLTFILEGTDAQQG